MIYQNAKILLILIGLIILSANVSFARHFSVNLKSINGSFVTAEGGGGSLVNANRDRVSDWEAFTLLDLNEGELSHGDPVAIKTVNGNFFSAINGGGDKLLADKTALVTWETFIIERMTRREGDNLIKNGNLVAFRSMNKNYISAVNGGGREVNSKPTAVGNNEMFTIRLNDEPTAGKLSGPFTAPQMIIPFPVGVDDLNRTEGNIKYCKNNYLGENFPNCYRGHEGTDFGLMGSFIAMNLGSIDIYSVAGGKVVAIADGNPDRCYYKFPPPPDNSKAEDFVYCPNDPSGAKAANFVAVLQDDGVIAYYFHLKRSSVAVSVGNRIDCGQFIGKVGSSGISSAPHLHLTLQRMKSDQNFPTSPEDFKNVGGNRDVANMINPYSPMLWQELIGRVPKKTCGKNEEKGAEGQPCRNITECKFGTICKDGKCQKPSLPNITPPSGCGNCPPFTECKNGKCVPKRP